jgi:Ca-activated chloride channel family protein
MWADGGGSMKLKTTVFLSAFCIAASSAAAFAIPMSHVSPPPTALASPAPVTSARLSTGDALLLDARLGHASIGRAGETYLVAQVTAPKEEKLGAAPPMNLGIIIDRSGSMKGERIQNAMNAAVAAVERMRDGDNVTVVAFDQTADVVVRPTRVGASSRGQIQAAIRSIRLGGDTCISCGLEEGMRQLRAAATTTGGDHIDRMILVSDGAANTGIKDVDGIKTMARRMNGNGVTISTIGVDVDFDEKLMGAIASEANGRHHFVANASSLPGVFAQEFDDVLASVANDAELVITPAPGVDVEEVFDRSFRREGDHIVVPFGAFSARQEKTVLIRLKVPTDKEGNEAVADLSLRFRDLVKKADASCAGTLSIAVKTDGSEQRELDPFVAARLERSRTAQTLSDANDLFEAGRVAEARAKLTAQQHRIAAAKSLAPSVAGEFDKQANQISNANENFGQTGSTRSRGGKAQVRRNAEDAFSARQ